MSAYWSRVIDKIEAITFGVSVGDEFKDWADFWQWCDDKARNADLLGSPLIADRIRELAAPVIVHFRKWTRAENKGEIGALFPGIEGNRTKRHCMDYHYNGQHGACDARQFVRCTVPAKPDEYASLARVLESLGYRLKIVPRITSNMYYWSYHK